MYNLFLDDIRFPYLFLTLFDKNTDGVSAYHYTNFEPFKNEKWIIARNYNEFVKIIETNGLPKLVSFDHDLGIEHYKNQNGIINYDKFEEKTGYDCAKWLCNYCQEHNLKFPDYYVHTMNPVGSINIKSYITNYKKHVENG